MSDGGLLGDHAASLERLQADREAWVAAQVANHPCCRDASGTGQLRLCSQHEQLLGFRYTSPRGMNYAEIEDAA